MRNFPILLLVGLLY